VRAQIVEYKLDADQDIHLVLADRGARMIAAMPAPRCLPVATRDRRALISVRRTFETRCGRATGSWRHLGAVASISGVGFWDSPRRQRGHARNDAALHPVTRLRLIAGCKLPSPPPPPPPPPPTPAADLSVTTSDAPDPVMVGDELRYTATVENRGPDQATGVRLMMALSSGSAEVAMATQGTCAGTTVTCELGTIASGATATAAIVVHPASAGTLTSTATSAATTRDPNAQNNTAVATTTVTP
jgi:uncharacterized repeat protein (TIGR01451 family)